MITLETLKSASESTRKAFAGLPEEVRRSNCSLPVYMYICTYMHMHM